MRIAIVAACPFPWPRGTPIRIHRMAEALSNRGHDVHVVAYHLGDSAVALPFALHRIRKIDGYNRHEPGPTLQKIVVLDPLLALKLRKLLRSLHFDVVHAHHYEGLLAAASACVGSRRPPIVYDAHTLLASELPSYRIGLPRSITTAIARGFDFMLPRLADHVITVSDEIADALVGKGVLAKERVTVIPNGVELQHFAAAGEPMTRGYGHQEHLVFAGNLAPYQRIDLLLQAFAAVHRARSAARLNIVTESAFDAYESEAEALGIRRAISVIRSDFSSLPKHLGAADVLLNPRTDCDGLPQKLLNYMAAGKPIVSFAGSARFLTHEESALIVADGDVEAFARAVSRVLDDRALGDALGANARRYVASRGGWEQVARRVESVYEDLTAGNPR